MNNLKVCRQHNRVKNLTVKSYI